MLHVTGLDGQVLVDNNDDNRSNRQLIALVGQDEEAINESCWLLVNGYNKINLIGMPNIDL